MFSMAGTLRFGVDRAGGWSKAAAARGFGGLSPLHATWARRDNWVREPMRREFRPSFTTVVVALLTLALGVMAWINFDQQRKFRPPDDGVTWQESGNGVVAKAVRAGSPAERAGIHAGDSVLQINGILVAKATTVTRELWRAGHDLVVDYSLSRNGVRFSASVLP